MKKILFLLMATLAFAGCSKVMYTESVYVIDYREYLKEGFTISPTVTGFNYQPISNIEVVFKAGELKKGESDKNLQKIPGVNGYASPTNRYIPTGKRMMDKIVSEAKSMGANGLIDFKTSYSSVNKTWSASGIAVEIKSK